MQFWLELWCVALPRRVCAACPNSAWHFGAASRHLGSLVPQAHTSLRTGSAGLVQPAAHQCASVRCAHPRRRLFTHMQPQVECHIKDCECNCNCNYIYIQFSLLALDATAPVPKCALREYRIVMALALLN